MSGVMGKQQKLFEVVLLILQTPFYGCKLIVVTHSLLFQSLYYLLIRLANGLGFIILDHHFVQPVFQDPNVLDQWAFLNKSATALFNFPQQILQVQQSFLFGIAHVFFFIELSPPEILVTQATCNMGGTCSSRHLLFTRELVPKLHEPDIFLLDAIDALFVL